MNPLMQNPQNQNNPMSMISEFMKFKKEFTGDPQQAVMQLLNSGQMSQAQFEQLKQQAQIFSQFLK